MRSIAPKKCLAEHVPIREFPNIRGTLFGGPYNKDATIMGTILGSPILKNPHKGLGLQGFQ